MGGHKHNEGGAGDYTPSCLGFGFINEAVGLTATETALEFALAHAAASMRRVAARCRHDEDGGGISPPHAGCCSGSERSRQWNCPVPLLLLNLTVAFKDGPVVAAIMATTADCNSPGTDRLCPVLSIILSSPLVAYTSNHEGCSEIFFSMRGYKLTIS